MRYRTHTDLDDQTSVFGDSQFVRLNTRVIPSALQPGEVQQSENMRMEDLSAQVRKGLTRVNTEIEISQIALDLPFVLDDGGTPPTVRSIYTDGVYGHCLFSDPNNSNQEWVVLATKDNAWLWRDGETAVSIAYPANEACDSTDTVHLEQVDEKVYLFRGYNDTSITDGSVVWDAVTVKDWEAATTYYVGELVRHTGDGFIAECTISGESHATTEPTWTGNEGPGLVDNGVTWTVYPLAAWAATTAYSSTYDASDETFRTIDTGITVLRCTTSGTSGGTEPDKKDRPVMSWDGNQSNAFVVVSQKRPVSATYRPLEAAPFALFYRSRLTKPITRSRFRVSDITTTSSSANEVEQYDSVNGDFLINYGSNDYLVGFSPFQEDSLLVFYRNSIHLVTDFSGSLANVAIQEVIRGVGCAARKTIVSAGEMVYWLGDGGIYSLNIVDQLNLKGVEVPLTRDIDDVFQTINTDAVSKAHGIYHNNRLYFAVPTETHTRPNKVLVYNLLNQGWESVDNYAPYIDGFTVSEYTSLVDGVNLPTKRLIGITQEAGLYIMEDNESGDEVGAAKLTGSDPETSVTTAVAGVLRTRAYNNGRSAIARFRRASANVYAPAAASFDMDATLQDPVAYVGQGTASIASTGDIVYRRNISKRGYACDIKFTSVTGRPSIRSVAVEATQRYRAGDLE